MKSNKIPSIQISQLMKSSIILIAFTLFSCSNTNIEITTENNFKTVDLPDGSKAYLNKNSSITYSESFQKRLITQHGEVFYSVVSGENSFVVKTETGEITVIGTEFNVKSHANKLEVEVEKGIVKLKSGKFSEKIKAGQNALFKDIKSGIKKGKAQFKHRKWRKDLNRELKKLSKEAKKATKGLDKEFRKGVKKITY
jgi:hypothetical protein